MTCPTCKTPKWMAFECIDCCLRWLSQMTLAEVQTNAPVIERVMGADYMNKVRQAWRKK